MIEREKYTAKDGKEYWSYILKGKIRRVMRGQVLEQDVKVNFVAKDQGGYEVLDIIFFGTDTAELTMREETMTNEKTGEVSKYMVYEIQTTDDEGQVFSYKVKLQRESDKSLLDMLGTLGEFSFVRVDASALSSSCCLVDAENDGIIEAYVV